MLKKLRYVLSCASLLAAIIFVIYSAFYSPMDMYQYMILILLILIASTFLIYNEETNKTNLNLNKKLEEVKNFLPPSSICVHDTVDMSTIRAVNNIGKITHVDMVAIDVGRRTVDVKRSEKVSNFVDDFYNDETINFRYVIKLNADNFINNIKRIKKSSKKGVNSFISYIEIKEDLPLVSFIILNNKVVLTRSPYKAGEIGKYISLENNTLVEYYIDWFKMLVDNSITLNSNEKILDAFNILIKNNQIEHEKVEELKKIDGKLFTTK